MTRTKMHPLFVFLGLLSKNVSPIKCVSIQQPQVLMVKVLPLLGWRGSV